MLEYGTIQGVADGADVPDHRKAALFTLGALLDACEGNTECAARALTLCGSILPLMKDAPTSAVAGE